VYGVWCMVYGVWCMVYGVWCMVYGVWYMVYGVWCMVYGAWCMVLSDQSQRCIPLVHQTTEFRQTTVWATVVDWPLPCLHYTTTAAYLAGGSFVIYPISSAQRLRAGVAWAEHTQSVQRVQYTGRWHAGDEEGRTLLSRARRGSHRNTSINTFHPRTMGEGRDTHGGTAGLYDICTPSVLQHPLPRVRARPLLSPPTPSPALPHPVTSAGAHATDSHKPRRRPSRR